MPNQGCHKWSVPGPGYSGPGQQHIDIKQSASGPKFYFNYFSALKPSTVPALIACGAPFGPKETERFTGWAGNTHRSRALCNSASKTQWRGHVSWIPKFLLFSFPSPRTSWWVNPKFQRQTACLSFFCQSLHHWSSTCKLARPLSLIHPLFPWLCENMAKDKY